MTAGSGSGLGYRAAVALWELTPEPPEPFDVITLRRSQDGSTGVRLHRPRRPPVVTWHRGVPVTTVSQSLLDFATVATQRELERAVREAHARWLITHAQVKAFAAEAKGRAGAPALREALGQEGASRSRTERAFLALCRREGLEEPLQNAEIAGESVDFYWPQHNLVVETDGYSTHATRHGFERDHDLDAHLTRHGIRVQRFSDRQIESRPSRFCTPWRHSACGARPSLPDIALSAATVDIRPPADEHELRAALALREAVFCEEQGVATELAQGLTRVGQPFQEAGIEHVRMEKRLA